MAPNNSFQKREWKTIGLSTSFRHNNRKNFRVGHGKNSTDKSRASILVRKGRRSNGKSFHDTGVRDAATNTIPMQQIFPAHTTPSSWLPARQKAEAYTYRVNAFDGSIPTLANNYNRRQKSFKRPLPGQKWLPITWVDEDELRRQEERRAKIRAKVEEAKRGTNNTTIKTSIYRVKKLSNHCCATTLYAQRMKRREKLGLNLT